MRKTMKIDPERLKKKIYERGQTLKGVSQDLGYSAAYLSIACKNGELSEQVVKMLKAFYDIDYVSYGYLEEVLTDHKAPEPEEQAISEIQELTREFKSLKAVLRKVVYEATRDAMIDAIGMTKDEMYIVMRNAMIKALNWGDDE